MRILTNQISVSCTTLIAALITTSAHAQSSVTVSGRIDLNVGKDIASDVRRMGNGAMSHLAFSGREDLGDGLNAFFMLDARLNAQKGTSNAPGAFLNSPEGTFWSQASYVGIGGKWGSLSLGRHMTAALLPQILVDPWFWDNTTAMFTATTGLIGNLWYNDSITYDYASGAFSLSAQVAQKDSNPGWGGTPRKTPYSFALGYAPGPWQLRLGYEKPADGTSKLATVFGSYAFDALTVNAMLGDGTNTGGSKVKVWAVSTVVPLGVGQLRASYGEYKNAGQVGAQKLSLGYYHFLSKRTAVYANVANDRQAAREKSGYELGLQHSF